MIELKEAREMASLVRESKRKMTYQSYDAVRVLDDRIIELEAQRDELFKACKEAIKHLSPTLRVKSGLIDIIVKIEGQRAK